jgi:phage portal protein BeeE
VQRANSLLAGSIAQLPCRVHQKVGDNHRVASEHPANRVISVKPNGWMTPFQVTEYKQHSMGLRGNSYSLMDRRRRRLREFAVPAASRPCAGNGEPGRPHAVLQRAAGAGRYLGRVFDAPDSPCALVR